MNNIRLIRVIGDSVGGSVGDEENRLVGDSVRDKADYGGRRYCWS